MKSWKTWLGCLGMAGACAAWSGCGEDDVPDPESDPHAATESSAAAEPRPVPAAAQNEQSEPVAAPAETTKAESAPSEAPRNAEAAKAAEPAAAEAEKPKSDSSATAERLAQAGNTTSSGGGGGASNSSSPPSGDYPGGPGGPPTGVPGMPGGPGGPGGADTGPADFRTQRGAVKAFLAAVRARDPARLKEATALRAPTESRPHNQKFFEAVLAETLAPDDIDELATKLEGFRIADANIPHSTAKRGIILRKAGGNGAFLQRTITVRKEKAGWKVVDISGEGKLEKPIVMPRMPGFEMPYRHH